MHLFPLCVLFSDSAHSFGATVACFLAGILMSSFGRRGSTLYFTIPCYFFGYIIIGSASNYMMLIGPKSLLNINDRIWKLIWTIGVYNNAFASNFCPLLMSIKGMWIWFFLLLNIIFSQKQIIRCKKDLYPYR